MRSKVCIQQDAFFPLKVFGVKTCFKVYKMYSFLLMTFTTILKHFVDLVLGFIQFRHRCAGWVAGCNLIRRRESRVCS